MAVVARLRLSRALCTAWAMILHASLSAAGVHLKPVGQVVEGEIERGDAAIAGQLLGGARACIRDGMAAKEQEELIERLEALEQAEEQRMQERRGFGA